MSHFWPADIDEESIQYLCSRNDDEYEIQSQQAINKYFSQQDIVPSPWVAGNKNLGLASIASQSSSCKTVNRSLNDRKGRKRTVWSQTLLTIPPSVDVESVLGQYFTFNCDQQEQRHESPPALERGGSFRDSFCVSLRRKLFCNGVGDEHSPTSSGGDVSGSSTDSSSSHTEGCGRGSPRGTPGSLNLCSSPIPPLRASSVGTTPIGEPMQLSPICRSNKKMTAVAGNKPQDSNGSTRRASIVTGSPEFCHSDTDGVSNEPEEFSPPLVPDEHTSTVQLGSPSSREDFEMSAKDKGSEASGIADCSSSSDSDSDSQCGRSSTVARRLSEMDTGYETYNTNGKLDSINLRLPSGGCSRQESGAWGSLVLSQQTDNV